MGHVTVQQMAVMPAAIIREELPYFGTCAASSQTWKNELVYIKISCIDAESNKPSTDLVIGSLAYVRGTSLITCPYAAKSLLYNSRTGSDQETLLGLEQANWQHRFPGLSIPVPIHTWPHGGNVLGHVWDKLNVSKGLDVNMWCWYCPHCTVIPLHNWEGFNVYI